MSTHTPPHRPAPPAEETWEALRRLALLFAIALLVAELSSAFAGIVVSVAGLAGLAAHTAARSRQR